jgi:CheY-like chemotaxis protein/DNA-binding transcriptional ArsR family regulator
VRLLVVDDDAVFREEFSDFLVSEGHDVLSAPNVRKALELLESEPMDAIFTDLRMPRQSGLELLSEVRHRWPTVHVVMVTGYATVQTAVDAMKTGAFDYIAKPFRGQQVQQVLQLIGEQRRFTDSNLPSASATEVARQLARRHATMVLLAAASAPPPDAHLQHLPFDGRSPSELMPALEAFLRDHPNGGLVIADAGQMLPGHRLDDVLEILRRLRERLDGVGPFAVGLDPRKIGRPEAVAIRSSVTAPAVQSALEVLSNPIRRRVLLRLANAPASFTEAMRAAELEDSPKLAFHMNRLVDGGLLARDEGQYAITPKGASAVAILRELEDVSSQRDPRTFVYVSTAKPASATEAAPTETPHKRTHGN